MWIGLKNLKWALENSPQNFPWVLVVTHLKKFQMEHGIFADDCKSEKKRNYSEVKTR